MQTWIGLLRGINVGGHHKLPMQALTTILESAGCRGARTYIQSGNVVFASPTKSKHNLCQHLGDAIENQFQFRPTILLLTQTEFRETVERNPFVDAISQPKTLHFFFLAASPKSPDLEGLATLAAPTERFRLIGATFYLHTPDGFGRSKLAAGAERKLGVPATARNYTTIQNLSAILDTFLPEAGVRKSIDGPA